MNRGSKPDAAMHITPECRRRPAGGRSASRDSRILETMPESLRVPLILRDMDGLSYQEISDDLELGLSAVKMRIKRAREQFRAAYERGAADVP